MSLKKVFTFLGWPILAAPIIVLYLGFALNQIAAIANHGQMPVRIANCAELVQEDDHVHFCADEHTRFQYLGDIFTTDNGSSSIGDEVIEIAGQLKEPVIETSWVRLPINLLMWLVAAPYFFLRKKITL